MNRVCYSFGTLAALWLVACSATTALGQGNDALVKDTLKKLNSLPSVHATEDTKGYKILFDAYLELTKPPFVVGPAFNQSTIHAKMSNWAAVSGWAESNAKMTQAILKCKDKTMIGLPYGTEGLNPAYVQAKLIASIGADGTLKDIDFPYIDAVDVIAAFAAAEIYRLMEAGQTDAALDLAVAHAFVLRQFCDREFMVEKLRAIELLSAAMANLRDVFHVYRDKITPEQYTRVALWEIPYLRPDRGRLFMPEADRVVAEALINEVFDPTSSEANPDKFTQTFAEIQSRNAPLTRFGAAKRWRNIAAIHGSREASLERLKLIYDDWWRRWRIDAYDDILAYPTQYERANKIRYAAVLYSLQDVEVLFEIRNQLIAEVNGTGLAAGLCAYQKTFSTYPDQTEKTYTQFARTRSDVDPFDKELATLKYRLISKRQSIDMGTDRLWIEANQGVLYSQGQDHDDDLAATHSDDGAAGDLVLWPPMKALAREQGFLE
ncbi:MAG: hypothetical protein L0219_09990 [Phycisphaerales bacterium]|nr:hypothetical protein [Phycisphaerales bacterium]